MQDLKEIINEKEKKIERTVQAGFVGIWNEMKRLFDLYSFRGGCFSHLCCSSFIHYGRFQYEGDGHNHAKE